MNRDRAYYRRQRSRVIHRKVSLLRRTGGEDMVRAWSRGSSGRFAKGKIHCSCRMCRRKTYDSPSIRDRRSGLRAEEQMRGLV